ncbi:hypothetical protein [Marinomonas atlantica]|uniref:hypothetical protein n=1 Tax=Marinomonas atlantica TaxID=1806668 RepID=UPI000B11E6F0|nr:hypothetical protein [Marinomonas atlantica]
MNNAVEKVKQSIDWKTVVSVGVGLTAFGVAVYAVKKSGKTGKKVASLVTGG